jgi:hypothetical protein
MRMLRYYAKNRWEYFVSLPSDSLFLMFLCITSGAVQLTNYVYSPVVEALVPLWVEIPWLLMLLFGSLITMIGLIKRPPGGFNLETPGRYWLGAASVCYGIAVFASTGPTAAALFTFGFGLSCFHRILHMRFLERQIAKVMKEIASVFE